MKLSPLAALVGLGCALSPVAAQDFRFWDGDANSSWTNVNNWDDDETLPAPGDDIEFDDFANTFTVNLNGTRQVGSLTFSSDSTPYTMTNGSFGLAGELLQDGEALVTFNNVGVILSAGEHAFSGFGDGDVILSGVVSGSGSILLETLGEGAYTFANSANTYSGGLQIVAGELVVSTTSGPLNLPASNATSSFFGNVSGAGSQIELNGGTLRLTTSGAGGAITPAASMEEISFLADGGMLSMNGTLAATNGFRLRTEADPFTPGVVSHSTTNSWNRTAGVNITSLQGTGALRVELSNGALAALVTSDTVMAALTVAGEEGGDSGTVGDGATTVGKFLLDSPASTLNLAMPLVLEHAVQISGASSNQTLNASMIVAVDADVAVQGRGTGLGTNHSVQLGQGGDDTITIETAGVLNIDSGFRSQAANGFVVINATTVIEPGGTLRFRRTAATGAASTSPHVWDGDVIGQGSSNAEAILDLALDVAGTGGSAVSPQESHDIIINGVGTGGLRAQAGGTVATQSSSARLQSYLSPARTAALTGTGGYLTIAPTNAAFSFTQAHQWSDASVGLRVENTVAMGTDLTFDGAAGVTFSRTLLVGSGATVDATGDTFAGIVRGVGAISGSPQVGGTGQLAPGIISGESGTLAFAGGLSLSEGATFTFDLRAPVNSDQVAVNGTLSLSSLEFGDFTFVPQTGLQPATYTLFTTQGITGGLGSDISGPIGAFMGTLDIDGNNVVLIVVPEPTAWLGVFIGAALLGLRRRRPQG